MDLFTIFEIGVRRIRDRIIKRVNSINDWEQTL